MQTPRIILGIDPGTQVLGYAVLTIADVQKPQCSAIGVLKLPVLPSEESLTKLSLIYKHIEQLIHTHHPTELAIESPFFGKNVQSMLKLGRAQGVVIAASVAAGLQVREYMPTKVKQSVTGSGRATKEQVLSMLEKILRIELANKYLDASDALGVALCHFFQSFSIATPSTKQSTTPKKDWSSVYQAQEAALQRRTKKK